MGRLQLRPLQQHFHALVFSDQFTSPRIRPISPCQPTSALAGPVFPHPWNLYSTFPGGALYTELGPPIGDSQILSTWTRSDRKLHTNCLELKVVISTLNHGNSASGPH